MFDTDWESKRTMFATALKLVSKFTYPVIISKRLYDGTVQCGCATFIVLNPEGWILTAAHVIRDLLLADAHAVEITQYKDQLAAIEANPKLSKNQKGLAIRGQRVNSQWIANCAYWWGFEGKKIETYHYDNLADLAIGRLVPFHGSEISVYPTFKNPSDELLTGTSLCRLGFPFHKIEATFDETTSSFQVEGNVLPMPRFPNDGIHTRDKVVIDAATGRQAKFIETSSPGLRGQSGGPIFDMQGNIWGIQSHTDHLALGFSPVVHDQGREFVEQQFLNVGLGSHVEEIVRLLREHNISFNISENYPSRD